MLDPKYLQNVTDGAESIAEQLHQDIIDRVVKRIMLRMGRGDKYILTAQDKFQLEVLQDAGYLLTDVKKEIEKRTRLQEKEIAEAFKDAGIKTVSWDNAIYEAAGLKPFPYLQSPYLMRLAEIEYVRTMGAWRNYTGTLANAAQRLFIEQCDKAYQLTASGAISYTQAVKEAVDTIAQRGVTVTYPSGHVDTIETATLRCVRTGISQSCAAITDARLDEMNWDIILVSAHLGARIGDGQQNFTNHAWWQGKFYSKSGADKTFLPFSVCGLGDVQGICGANCRHSYGAGDGKHNPYEKFDSKENLEAYELTQRQRALERRIRKTKREAMTLRTAYEAAQSKSLKQAIYDDYTKKAKLLQRQNAVYNQFCADNDVRPLQDRLRIAKWDRKQAALATAAARK